jgi:DNA-binding beta-propeller fold protein YncE
MKYYYIDGSTGEILQTVDVSFWGHHAYGAVIDRNGVLWSSGQRYYHVLRLDPSGDFPTISRVNMGHFVYGLGLDYLDHLFVSAWSDYRLSRVNITTGAIEWRKYKTELLEARGVACTSDNDVWVVSTYRGSVYRYDNEGIFKAEIEVGDGPTGVAVDAAGKVWVCNSRDEYIKRIDPATNTVDLEKRIIGSDGHYTYSDMTGMMSRTVTTRVGTWTVVLDGDAIDTTWEAISWTGEEPEGTSITVKVRSSNDQGTWTAWEVAANGASLNSTSDGRYAQVEVTLQAFTGDVTPILYDLTVESDSPPVIPDDLDIDIKPGSCPNPLNPKSRGVLSVAILGTEFLDVTTIDPETILLAWDGGDGGIRPVRWSFEDVATPFEGGACECHEFRGDGYTDLTLKFDTQELVKGLGLEECSGDTVELTLIGSLNEEYDSTPIEGRDCVRILGKKGKGRGKKKGK